MLDHIKGLEPQEVHLHKAAVLKLIHGVLSCHAVCLVILSTFEKRNIFRKFFLADYNTCCMERGMTGHVLQVFALLEEPLIYAPFLLYGNKVGDSIKFRKFVELRLILILVHLAQHSSKSCLFMRRIRYVLYYVICLGERNFQYPGHILYNSLGLECSESDYLSYLLGTIFMSHIIDHLLTAFVCKIHVKIGQGDPFFVEEPLEKQVIFKRIDVGYFYTVGYNRSCSGTKARTHRYAVVL